LSAETLNAGDPLTATVNVTNAGPMNGDEVVQAYLKTPQADGPIHSLAGFERVNIPAGQSRKVTFTLDPRTLSSVDDQGKRSILAGKYTLTLGGGQPQQAQSEAEAVFTITGKQDLPK
jgi:beta-glucosidase